MTFPQLELTHLLHRRILLAFTLSPLSFPFSLPFLIPDYPWQTTARLFELLSGILFSFS